MDKTSTLASLINSIIPISRFNKGEASKIFDEVKATGFKVVLKNNSPACVLLSPELYEEMTKQLEDYKLLTEAQNRYNRSDLSNTMSHKSMLNDFGITNEELSAYEDVELE